MEALLERELRRAMARSELESLLPFERWPGVLGGERLTGAPLDRLAHRGSAIETGVEGDRPRGARRRRRGRSKDTGGEAQA